MKASKTENESLTEKRLVKKISNFFCSSVVRRIWLVVIGVLLGVSIFTGLYYFGYNQGGRQAKNERFSGSTLNTIQTPNDRIQSGLVDSVSTDAVVITVNDRQVTYQLADNTKVREGKVKKTKNDLRKGMRVTVIKSADKNKAIASTILIRGSE